MHLGQFMEISALVRCWNERKFVKHTAKRLWANSSCLRSPGTLVLLPSETVWLDTEPVLACNRHCWRRHANSEAFSYSSLFYLWVSFEKKTKNKQKSKLETGICVDLACINNRKRRRGKEASWFLCQGRWAGGQTSCKYCHLKKKLLFVSALAAS